MTCHRGEMRRIVFISGLHEHNNALCEYAEQVQSLDQEHRTYSGEVNCGAPGYQGVQQSIREKQDYVRVRQ